MLPLADARGFPTGYSFIGSGSYISSASAAVLDTSSFVGSAFLHYKWTGGSHAGLLFAINAPSGQPCIQLSQLVGDDLYFQVRDDSVPNGLAVTTSAREALYDDTWAAIYISWNTNAASGAKTVHFYIDDTDVSDTVADNDPAFSLGFGTSMNIGGFAGGSSNLYGNIANLYINTREFIDFSSSSNRDKFANRAATPHKIKGLGPNGQQPTGNIPFLYLRNNVANLANFGYADFNPQAFSVTDIDRANLPV